MSSVLVDDDAWVHRFRAICNVDAKPSGLVCFLKQLIGAHPRVEIESYSELAQKCFGNRRALKEKRSGNEHPHMVDASLCTKLF